MLQATSLPRQDDADAPSSALGQPARFDPVTPAQKPTMAPVALGLTRNLLSNLLVKLCVSGEPGWLHRWSTQLLISGL